MHSTHVMALHRQLKQRELSLRRGRFSHPYSSCCHSPPSFTHRLLSSMRSLRGIPTHSGGASYAVEWSSPAVGGGRIVAFATEYGDVTVLDTRQVATNPVQCISRSNDNLVHDIIWLGDEAVLAMGGSDQMVRIVDVESGAKIWSHDVHTGSVKSLSCNTEHPRLIASGGRDGVVAVSDTRVDSTSTVSKKPSSLSYSIKYCNKNRKSQAITAVQWLPDSRHLLLGSQDGTVCLWDVRGGSGGFSSNYVNEKSTTQRVRCFRNVLIPTPANLLSAQQCSSMYISKTTGIAHSPGVHSISTSDNGCSIAIGLVCGLVAMYSLSGGRIKHEGNCYGCEGASFYTKISLSPCGRWLLGGGGTRNSDALLWNVEAVMRKSSSDLINVYPSAVLLGHTEEVMATNWSKQFGEARCATSSDDGTVRTWWCEGEEGEVERHLRACFCGRGGHDNPTALLSGDAAGYAEMATKQEVGFLPTGHKCLVVFETGTASSVQHKPNV